MKKIQFYDKTLEHCEGSFSLSTAFCVLRQELARNSVRYKFKSRVSLGSHNVDFCCSELKFIVEVIEKTEEDDNYRYREDWLLNRGYTIVKFTHTQILEEREKVIHKILVICLHLTSLT